ncbi:hypothetical protein KY342_04490 [Candidatus Woesearchaeota archaeon]|nr:hypothetical protein [Candidatus Woesearchaeota archaeon]
MTTLNKIDKYLNKMEEKKSDKLQFLYKTEDLEGIVGFKTMQSLLEKRKVGGAEYDKFFTKMLKKWKVKSYKDLPKNKQDDFFNDVDKGWNSKKEKGKDGIN